MKLCTYNLRLDTDWDGDRRFTFRRPLISSVLRREAFDVIGFQEVLPAMRAWLDETLKEYTIVGVGREKDLGGEQNPVAFRTDRFFLLSCDTFWLSDTPDEPGSRHQEDPSACPRLCTCVRLMSRATGDCLRVYNTHLDHVSAAARERGARQILARVAADAARFPQSRTVVMGDFNATPDTPFLRLFEAQSLSDAAAATPFTYHEYHPERGGTKIDYLFTDFPATSARVLDDTDDHLFLSDHYPVAVEW